MEKGINKKNTNNTGYNDVFDWIYKYFLPSDALASPTNQGLSESSGLSLSQREPFTSLEEGWLYVLTDSEKALTGYLKQQKKTRERELDELVTKKLNTKKLSRSYWNEQCSLLLNDLPLEEKERVSVVLEASARYSLINKIVEEYKNTWLYCLQDIFFSKREKNSFWSLIWKRFVEYSYYSSAYEKNVVGNLKDVGFFFSHGDGKQGLTEKTLCDLIEGWSQVLIRELKFLLREEENSSVFYDDIYKIQSCVYDCLVPFIFLYSERVETEKSSRGKEGLLPDKWRKEDEMEKERLLRIKEEGADARWEEHESNLVKSVDKMDSSQIEMLKNFLESRLVYNQTM